MHARATYALVLLLAVSCAGPVSTAPGADTAPGEADPAVDPDTQGDVAATASEAEPTPVVDGRPVRILDMEAAAVGEGAEIAPERGKALVHFNNVGGVRRYAGRIVNKVRRAMGRASRSSRRSRGASLDAPMPTRSAPATESPAPEESVTNTQVAGVDEGGIVKAWGEFLVILRRGRLFTARLGDTAGGATPVSAIGVRPPGSDHEAWYDEMLVHASTGTVVVVGFSYEHEATEIGLFRISPSGELSHKQTHLLRSNDYYSDRNYASRLVGDSLVFYMPHYLMQEYDGGRRQTGGVRVSLPATRAFRGASSGWRPIVAGSEVYRVAGERDAMTLHTVVTCDLAARRFSCRARGVIGGEGRTFFVSRNAIYVWVTQGWSTWRDYVDEDVEGDPAVLPAQLYRLPLDGGAPSALLVRGAPVDQFSFHETGDALYVVIRADGGGDAMWAPELSEGAVGLVRVPLSAFGRNVRALGPAAYRTLPSPGRTAQAFQNRFVGDYLLYGAGTTWDHAAPTPLRDDRLFLHRYGERTNFVAQLPHGVDRIEAMGEGAVVIGTDGQALHFRALGLGERPTVGGTHMRAGAAQGELRSHGFFYKPTGANEGVLGLPTRSAAQPGSAHLVHGSAEVMYLGVRDLDFSPLGVLEAGTVEVEDGCEVSCVDWYGNARPLFYRGRVFALLGYELVEGRIAEGAIHELARTSFLSAIQR